LEGIARPGWQEPDGLPGAPAGWHLFTGVELVEPISTDHLNTTDDFSVLDAVAASQLFFPEGFVLPGRHTWHRDMPPQIRAVAPTAGPFTLRLIDLSDEMPVALHEVRDQGSGEVILDFGDGDTLEPGDYGIVGFLEDDRTNLFEDRITIVDGDSARPGREEHGDRPLAVHGFPTALCALGAVSAGPQPPTRESSGEPDEGRSFIASAPPSIRVFDRMRFTPERTLGAVRLTRVDTSSCLFTGAHRWDIEMAKLNAWGAVGRHTPPSIGVCGECGSERAFENRWWRTEKAVVERNRARMGRSKKQGTDLRESAGEASLPWETLIDSLCYLGSGTWAEFARVVRQIDGDAKTMGTASPLFSV
jgi:hypothetical protein